MRHNNIPIYSKKDFEYMRQAGSLAAQVLDSLYEKILLIILLVISRTQFGCFQILFLVFILQHFCILHFNKISGQN